MPSIIVPTGGTSAVFYTSADILNYARLLVNGMQGTAGGDLLRDADPATWILFNLCYAKLANWLEDNGVESAAVAEWEVSIPPGVSPDPNAQSFLAYDAFYAADGTRYPTVMLPQNMLMPVQLWSRPTGQNQPFTEMRQKLGGLSANFGNYVPREWEFRQNAIYIAGGATQGWDMRIRGIPSFAELQAPQSGQATIIPFARAGEALAYLVAAEYQEIRNAVNAPTMRAKANEQLDIIANKAAKRENQSQVRRRGYGFGRRGARPYIGIPG